MILTKQLEAEIIQFLDTYWEKYITGDFDTWSTFLMNEYKNIGTNQEEIWLNKKEILDYSLSMADQLIGQLKIKNKTTHVYPLDPYILAHEFGDMFIKVEGEWVFYAKLRLSSILQQTDTGWKVLHQHGSFPDAKTDDGEFLAFEDISRENSELRDAIKRRTAELEIKNRELEIEAALDRVRARSMAMHKSEELAETAYVLFQEFRSLENTSGQATIGIMNEAEGNMELWLTVHGNQMNRSLDVPLDEPIVIQKLYKGWKAGEKSIVIDLNKKDLEEYNKFRNSLSDVNFKTQEVENRRVIQVAFFSHGVISLASPEPNSDSSLHLLSRFANVFEHNYRRFLDLQKAEAQAREAQIELALEKVRARTMAMHKSDELHDVAEVLFQQLRNFGGDLWGSGIGLCTSESEEDSFWFVNEKGILPTVSIPHTEDPTHRKLFEGWQNNESLVVDTRDGKELSSHYTYMLSLPSVKGFFQGILDAGLSFPTWQRWHAANFSNGYLLLITTSPYAHEELLVRFAKVFEQAYIRFLDLQKAEAQAREAQIEHALEKVRARTMAMQHSEELPDAANVLFLEIQALGIPAWSAGYNILSDDKKSSTCIMSSEGEIQTPFILPLTEHASLRPWHEAILQELPFFVYQQGGKELVEHYEYMATIPGLEEVFQQFADAGISLPTFQVNHLCRFTNGFLLFITYEQVPDAHDIFNRFAAVFQQTYTRFLDLQKAEAQAREAQIQLSLERVRARSMAMHSSEELNEVLSILFQQFDVLGITPINVWLSLLDEEKGTFTYRSTGTSGSRTFTQQVIAFKAMDIWQEVLDQWKSGTVEPVLVTHYPAERLPEVFEVFKETFMAMPEKERINITAFPNGFYNIQGYCRFGYIGYNHIHPPSEEQKDLVTKFAREFERVYQRFLDIEKAEAQTKEAQIEAALERVRAASMAMHQTEDIGIVVQVYFEQLKYLEIPFEQAWITILKLEEGYFDTWFSPIDGIYDKPTHFKMPSAPFEDTAIKNWKAGVPLSYMSLKTRSEVDQFLSACDEMTNSKYFTHSQKKRNNNKLEFLEARHKFGFISKTTKEAPTKEDEEILMRFASVFEQTYTRFLDIQKAEAQAREAQIEAALEKVRSRSLAMQSAEELQEVVTIVGEKLQELGVILDSGGVVICTYFPDSKDVLHWTANFDASFPSVPYYLPYFDTPIWRETWHSKFETDDDFFEKVYSFEDKNHFFHYAFEHSDYKNLPDEYKKALLESETHALSFAWQTNSALMVASHTGMLLPTEHKNILKRFAKVFEQAYIRFMDLEKAEKQTRESQIELALERVRAKAMAMRESEELTEVLPIIFEQLDGLGVKTVWTHLTLMDMEKNTFTYRMTGREGKRVFAEQVVDMDASEIWQNAVEAFKAEEPDSIVRFYFPPDALPGIWEIFDGIFSTLSEGYKIHQEDFPGGIYTTQANCEFGYIGLNNTKKATEEEENILLRFAKEFGRLYRRFLDLQNAEAQAREAKVETALERVRARSLAMHHSDEMQSVANAVYDQLIELGIETDAVGMSGVIEAHTDYDVWIGGSPFSDPIRIPFNESTQVQRDYNEVIEQRPELFVKTYSGEIKKEYINHLLQHGTFAEDLEKKMVESAAFSTSISTAKNSGIQIVRYNDQPYTDQENEILKRFAKVFEQAYIRFMDLQKSEAQARKAQIEAALERVRARSMAMHQTDELNDVLCVLLEQFDFLGINPVLTHLTLFDEANQKFSLRLTTSPTEKILVEQIIDIYAVESWRASYENWKNGDSNTVDCIDYPPEVLPAVWEVLSEVMNALPEGHKINPADFPDGLFTTQGHFKFGYLGFNHRRKATEEEKNIVSRFATEFGRAYQRFLDIQKAEAQAKEAQIEAALEKVRSRSLAMQRSDELQDVVQVVAEKLTELGVVLEIGGIAICTYFENSKDVMHWTASNDPLMISKPYYIEYYDTPMNNETWAAKLNGDSFYEKVFSAEDCKHYFDNALENTAYKNLPEGYKELLRNTKQHGLTFALQKNSSLMVPSLEGKLLKEEDKAILIRFSKVFEQAYIRFMDIKKSEEQTREAQIENAIEKIRSRTMAMQHSDELTETSYLLDQQVRALGIKTWGCAFSIYRENDSIEWFGNEAGILPTYTVPREGIFNEYYELGQKGESLYVKEFSGQECIDHYEFMSTLPVLGDVLRKLKETNGSYPDYQIDHVAFFKYGYLLFITIEHVPESYEIFKRFAKVFEQTYTRFLDLQKSEAQAKESQIQLALERVRARTMAMHQSEELAETAAVVFQQMTELGVTPERLNICLINEDNNTLEVWSTDQNGIKISHHFDASLDEPTTGKKVYNAWKAKKKSLVIDLSGSELNDWVRYVREVMGMTIKEELLKDHRIHSVAFFSHGMLLTTTNHPLPEESMDLLKRFADVFNLTYTRFLDLQRAEEQAREAEIELALERVRSQAMAMQKSTDLLDIVVTMRNEFTRLGHEAHYFWHMMWLTEKYEKAMTSGDGTRIGMVMELPRHIHGDIPLIDEWEKSQDPTVVYPMDPEAAVGYVDKMIRLGDFKQVDPNAPSADDIRHIGGLTFIMARTTHGEIGYSLPGVVEQPPKEDLDILIRFAGAFDIAHQRFLDLQKSEAQSREVEIELALEKVRSRSMGMQKSDELKEVIRLVYQQLIHLHIKLDHAGFVVDYTPKGDWHFWIADDVDIPSKITHPYFESVWARQFNEAKEKGANSFTTNLDFDEKNKFYTELLSHIPELPEASKEFYLTCPGLAATTVLYDDVSLYIENFEGIPYSDQENNIVIRFGKVFQQSYTRFLDLQRAEAQARLAQIETSLERVRARALAMQEPEELIEVAEVLRHEMGLLGIEELETASIYIHDEDYGKTECWYALKDVREEKSALVSDHFALDLSDTWVGREMIKFYEKDDVRVSIVMQGKNRVEWIRYCEEKSTPFQGYYGEIIPDRTYHLYKFSDGAIGAAAPGDISEESWELLRRAASVFSLAYSRFKDLTQARVDLIQLKTEKQRAEEALTNLKAAQSQLVQAEKMASLGELTAGIAHEIQNPLNFVNNFSEVSAELLDEMVEEINANNNKEVKIIAKDIKQNIEKILHHGKRADDIVKGMLQHSRNSSGTKEPTDINALADEYFRLAYHGLRAKDKSFNAKMETNFDNQLKSIEVIPQDIGRVLLNLMTNAFYAVSEKKKAGIENYTPSVTVTTRLLKPPFREGRSPQAEALGGLGAEISVHDNGSGIPPSVVEKIFQPFFTTKPTGQGTGLGLSLAYDIVKAHGGEINVKSKPGDTSFTITLPQKHSSV